ncbi:MAG: hypothetical protein Q9226_004810 [Calogaya cf. arnoldii]
MPPLLLDTNPQRAEKKPKPSPGSCKPPQKPQTPTNTAFKGIKIPPPRHMPPIRRKVNRISKLHIPFESITEKVIAKLVVGRSFDASGGVGDGEAVAEMFHLDFPLDAVVVPVVVFFFLGAAGFGAADLLVVDGEPDVEAGWGD